MTKGKKQSQKKRENPSKQTAAPLAVGGVRKASRPVYSKSPDGTFSVHRRELVCGLSHSGSATFTIDPLSASTPGFDLNPATDTLFPWLSSMAVNFERYKFSRLSFEIVPSQAATTAGRYYMAVDYDYDDPVATTKAQLMANVTAAEAAVWQPLKIQCPYALLHGEMPFRYCAHTGRVSFVEPRTAFCGFLLIGYDATAALSFDLWVDYDVTLVAPCVEGPTVFDTMGVISDTTGVTAITSPVGADHVHLYGELISPTGQRSFTKEPDGCPARLLAGAAVPRLLQPCLASNATDAAQCCFDLKDCARKGVLELMTAISETGVSPQSLIGTKVARMEVTGYRSDGTRVGCTQNNTLSIGAAIGATNSLQSSAPANPSQLATASSQIVAKVAINLATLFAVGAIRYIVPYVVTSQAMAAGTLKDGMRFAF